MPLYQEIKIISYWTVVSTVCMSFMIWKMYVVISYPHVKYYRITAIYIE